MNNGYHILNGRGFYGIRGRETGEIRFPGLDYGRRVFMTYRAGDYAIIEVKGGEVWAGVGFREYHGAAYMLCRVKMTDEQKLAGEIVQVENEVEPGRRWRSTRNEMIARIEELTATV